MPLSGYPFQSTAVFDVGPGSKREREESQMSAADGWIAASALVLFAPLVTNNPNDYRHLGSLQLVSAAA